ncbi:MAG: antA/AntB antirepressor family protein [Marinobacterium sp.]|nr:antA/AntB antirepressor family protein [Marinobacterium sp.]
MAAQLLPIHSRIIAGDPVETINARQLHAFLEIGKTFAAWIVRRIGQYGFEEKVDFIVCFPKRESKGRGGHNAKEYFVTLDMAKELSMVERNAKGREARRYFIECEKQLKAKLKQEAVQPELPMQRRGLDDHTADQADIKRLIFQDRPMLTLAMVNQLHRLSAGTAQRIYQRDRDSFMQGDILKVSDNASLQLLRKMGVRTGRNILLLTASGYQRLATLIHDSGQSHIDPAPIMHSYFGHPGSYDQTELQTLREAYELMMQWKYAQHSDLSEKHREWQQQRWHQQAERFVHGHRLLGPPGEEHRHAVADRLLYEWTELDHIAESKPRQDQIILWRLNCRVYAHEFDILNRGKPAIPPGVLMPTLD